MHKHEEHKRTVPLCPLCLRTVPLCLLRKIREGWKLTVKWEKELPLSCFLNWVNKGIFLITSGYLLKGDLKILISLLKNLDARQAGVSKAISLLTPRVLSRDTWQFPTFLIFPQVLRHQGYSWYSC